MNYVYSQDPNTKRWTVRDSYPGLIHHSGSGDTKEEALKNLLRNKQNAFNVLHTKYY